MTKEKHKIGEIEFHKGGWSITSESFFPKYFPTFWIVRIPLLKKQKDMKPGETQTTGLGFNNEADAQTFSEFLKGHMKKYIKYHNRERK